MSIEACAISNVVVETTSLLVATEIAVKAQKKDEVRGKMRVNGKSYRWSTYQQFNHHGGFAPKAA